MNKFDIRAIGWSIEVSAQSLTRDEYTFVRKWCSKNGHEPENFSGNLEGELPGYNAYSTNLWQTGCVPMLELNRFFLYNHVGNALLPITAPLIRSSEVGLRRCKGSDIVHPLKPRHNRVLVYFEETKGVGAVWRFPHKGDPDIEKFTILYSKFSLGDESFYYVVGLEYKGKELERNYDLEDLSGKASYSKLL